MVRSQGGEIFLVIIYSSFYLFILLFFSNNFFIVFPCYLLIGLIFLAKAFWVKFGVLACFTRLIVLKSRSYLPLPCFHFDWGVCIIFL
ncbi:hypothetical protein A2313_00460 [Candidatus Roizmanbacteria bacterium RIFOXYB2_FULL_41_10]|uniref:Uncharacterized protein n=1 Tax=Candidatus Roizmanbacteria bacterium RIFOXYA1_FULL_41_12 TaxID=1802082 RepID=A0A1F7KAJ6_9BACT|nr:MAG: hypothetical protein A2209_04260 [Candidatus Roizmanbacteria bacterium RIFOXYA1_FULL_41_12]OGK66854.1 MAG: hypothetical protein A2377_03065 [Candidatus Roizmanbacteria bacterium RIFOXYB1_FULL_41_27]OGK67259.1 MAG: hypothetical protein A2262_01765 [Candidatus Roizmanbacteria bacterium RIFOXYA2_FULL_41_8]OGK70772.1 MAG: hypothetical protein A2403_01640 [Candidatus Roizmanbacteria bacterium RIFOXYC1_FULL_41_16]OGK71436.1 MAG: hypothetical protein A2313_00460 [Candidatus Roizmanbacteria bac